MQDFLNIFTWHILYYETYVVELIMLINCLHFVLVCMLRIIAEFNDGRRARYDDRRRSDRSREHSRERYYDPYDSRYNDYYRAMYARG